MEITIGYRGNPKPTVTWYHNNIELVAPATQDSDPVALIGSHSLVLNVVMETNGGTYRAELVNSYGSDVVTVSLNVSGEWCVWCVVCVCGVCVVCVCVSAHTHHNECLQCSRNNKRRKGETTQNCLKVV